MKATEDIEIKAFKEFGKKICDFEEKYPWIDYFIAPVLVTTILLIVYAMKGVYPFGLNTIAYYDMPTNVVTGYTWMWDVLHGRTGLYLNLNEGLGVSMAAGGDVFFPINWLLLLSRRDNILFFMSILLVIKLGLSAFSISFYLKKQGYDTFITVCSGILYAFSGYVLQYYTNNNFIDFVIMLPLIVYALEELIQRHKCIVFTILMFFTFICNIQLVFMVCIYIVFKSYFILRSVPDDKKGKSLRLLAGTVVVAVLLAGFILVPEILQLSSTGRVKEQGSGFDYLAGMKQVYCQFRRQKHFIMYGAEIAVGLFMLLVLRGRECIKRYYQSIVMIVILAFPIIHEGINLLWHAGSYKHFPVRFGYMLTFECLVFVGEYVSKEEFRDIRIIGRITRLLGLAALPFVAFVLFEFLKPFTDEGIGDLGPYISYWIYFVTLSVVYFIIFLMGTDTARRVSLILLAIIQAFCGAYGFVAPREAYKDNYRIKYILNEIELGDELNGLNKKTDRIKADPLMYESNYAFISDCAAVSYWSYGVTNDFEQVMRKNMGYDGDVSYLMDTGGTVFSDALLNVKYAASSENPDSSLYENMEDKSNLYRSRYVMPFGVMIGGDNNNGNETGNFEFHNLLFKDITGIKEELIAESAAGDYINGYTALTDDEVIKIRDFFTDNAPKERDYVSENMETDSEETEDTAEETAENSTDSDAGNNTEKTYKISLSIPISGLKSLYLTLPDDYESTLSFIKDGKPMYFSSFITYRSNAFPNGLRNGILALGTYEDETYDVDVYSTDKEFKDVKIGLLDLDLLEKGIALAERDVSLNTICLKEGMKISGSVGRGGRLFIPVAYSDNWGATINGNKAQIIPCINNAFISLDVNKGDVDISLSYRPKGLIPGLCLTGLGGVLAMLGVIILRKGHVKNTGLIPVLDKVILYTYYVAVGLLFIFMYFIPICIKMAI